MLVAPSGTKMPSSGSCSRSSRRCRPSTSAPRASRCTPCFRANRLRPASSNIPELTSHALQAQAASLLQTTQEQHEAELQELVSKFGQAQDLSAFVSAEMTRMLEELKAVKEENKGLAAEVRASAASSPLLCGFLPPCCRPASGSRLSIQALLQGLAAQQLQYELEQEHQHAASLQQELEV